MAAKSKLSAVQRQRIAEVLAARKAVPSDKELAREYGVSVAAIRWTMGQLLESAAHLRGAAKLARLIGSTGNKSGTL